MNRRVVIGVVLAVLGIARLATVVFHEPIAGFANQYDMIRLSACAGLYPALPEPERFARTPEAPIANYLLAPPRPQECQRSSELVFVETALLAHRLAHDAETTQVDLRWIGAVKLAFAAGMVAIVAFLLRRYPVSSLIHGLAVLLVLGDPLVGLWFNTLYSETAMLLGAYFLIALLAVVFVRERGGPWMAVLIVAAACLLGLSKEQYFALPLALVAIASVALWRAGRVLFASAVIAALLPVALFIVPLPGNAPPSDVHRLDTYLGALVASSDDPDATRRRLGLPQRCDALAGATHLRLRGEDPAVACPEVRRLSSFAFARLLVAEPRTFSVAFARGVTQSQNAFTSLGTLAGRTHARADALAPWAFSVWYPFFARLHVGICALIVVAMLALSASAFVAALFGNARLVEGMGLPFTLGMLGVCYAYSLVTAVLGDGFDDTAKHVVFGSACLAAWITAAPVAAWLALKAPPATLGTRLGLAASVLFALGMTVLAWDWSGGERLAFGVIDEPAGRRADPKALVVRGWALDPFGVESVDAQIGARRFRGAFGAPVPGLALHFPAFPDGEKAGYSIAIPAEALGTEAAELRVFVTNSRGVRTEIDRRRLTLS